MIVQYWIKDNMLWMRTEADVDRGKYEAGANHVLLDGYACRVVMLNGEWSVVGFWADDVPTHSLGTADPEIAVAKLNLLYRTE